MIDRDTLYRLYDVEEKTTYEIADIFSVDRSSVCLWLKKYNIKTRIAKRDEAVLDRKLTEIQKNFLIGSILGDGHITDNRKTPVYTTSHSDKQKEYIYWNWKIFGDLGNEPKLFKTINKTNNKTYSFYNFRTKCIPELKIFREIFYTESRTKIIPENIKDIIVSPFSFAVWLMEDGSFARRGKQTILCTDCFTYREHEILKDAIECNFKLKANIIKYNDRHFRLRFGASEAQKIKELLEEHIIESMKYKIF